MLMEVFYSDSIYSNHLTLNGDEAHHCCRVMRHKEGDEIDVIDGKGGLYHSRIDSITKTQVSCSVIMSYENYGSHPYFLTLAVCPPKNIDRYEFMAQKCTEIGFDVLVPLIGERSVRRIINKDRLDGIILSAAKQSLKAAIPVLEDPVSVKDFILSCPEDAVKMIGYCFEEGDVRRQSIVDVLSANAPLGKVVMLVGPEGDFSPEEVALALENGFQPVHLGNSRLRTETAAIIAASAVYLQSI